MFYFITYAANLLPNTFKLYLLTSVAYNLTDCAVANILCVQTLRHGTNLVNYISIRLFGAHYKLLKQNTGSIKNFVDNEEAKDNFYMFKDPGFTEKSYLMRLKDAPNEHIKILETINDKNLSTQLIYGIILITPLPLIIRLQAFRHIHWSTINLFKSNAVLEKLVGIPSLVMTFLTPTINFCFVGVKWLNADKYKSSENYISCNAVIKVPIVTDDIIYKSLFYSSSIACMTKNAIPFYNIGMLGSLIAGVNINIFKRIKDHPEKLITGLIQAYCLISIFRTFSPNGISSIKDLNMEIFKQVLTTPSLVLPIVLGIALS